jgi:hypothetical protein
MKSKVIDKANKKTGQIKPSFTVKLLLQFSGKLHKRRCQLITILLVSAVLCSSLNDNDDNGFGAIWKL